jgi:hypothetical protein
MEEKKMHHIHKTYVFSQKAKAAARGTVKPIRHDPERPKVTGSHTTSKRRLCNA